MAPLDERAMQLAAKQFGVVARGQLLRWSTERQIDGLVSRGTLVRLQRGVYRVAGGAVLAAQQPIAAALRCGDDATVSGPFVLAHLRVDGFNDTSPFEILVPKGRRLQGIDFPIRRDPQPDRGVMRVGDVRFAGPMDALIDACRWRPVVPDRCLRLAYDWLRWHGLVELARLRRTLGERSPGDEGARQLLDLLGGCEGLVPESEGERVLAPVLRRFDPAPVPQVWVTERRRTDWYFASIRLAIEYQGTVDHGTAVGQATDTTRRRELERSGIAVTEVTPRELDDPDALARRLAGVVAVRAAELGVDPPRYRLR